MRLIVSEKNIAAKKLAEILAVGKPTADKVYSTPVYRFRRDGEDWVSIGLKGHIIGVDFPEEFSKWRLEDLGEMIDAELVAEPAEKGIIQSLRNLAKKADHIVIATDFDREGELIGADARDIMLDAKPGLPVQRVRYSAITREEIERAFAEIGPLDDNLAAAGASRRDIDLIWGAVLTRYLTITSNKAAKRAWGDVLSAGRVQTPTLKLVVDREREREAFVPEDYWVVKGRFEAEGEEFVGTHEGDRFSSEEAAQRVMEAVGALGDAVAPTRANVVELSTKRRTVKPPAPFNTTSLMAAASAEGFTPSRTMRIAESLYMDGLISYPRVDNTVYPPSLDLDALLRVLDEVPIYHEHVGRLRAKGALTPTRGSKETTDHPPIHPTGAADPERMKPEAYKLYNLVARRFLATLSAPAVLESTKAVLDVAGEKFIARGDVVITPGFRAVYPYGLKKDEQLPTLEQGGTCGFLGADMEAKQTQPPARFSQGKLLQEMEKRGLGTKATRHDIIQTLYDRKYIANDPAEPTCKGRSVIDALVLRAERITNPEMTAELDAEMDAIANARNTREDVVGHSRVLLGELMEVLLDSVPEVGEALKAAADEDAKVGICPQSGDDLLIKYSPKTRAYFVGCQGYPDCSVTYPLPKNARFAAVDEMCAECGSPQVKVMQFKRPVRVMCLAPDCITKKGPEIEVGRCAQCGGALTVKYSQVGSRYVRCENYDAAEHPVSYPLPQTGELEATGETCEPCGAPKVVVHTKKGPWRICIDPDCPARVESKKKAPARKGARKGSKPAAKSGPKPAAKKPASAAQAKPRKKS
ncbi:MAG: DNA topoisomerase I [Coriobacteriia bacterium]|nr:DNA topoisomerase I [Coriobacteriia bacterium]